MARQLGVALFGLGRKGASHVRQVASDKRVIIRALVGDDTSLARRLRDEINLGGVTSVLEWNQAHSVLRDPSIDVVVISSPVHDRFKVIESSLKAGKKVFCETAVTPAIADMRDCYKQAVKTKLPLFGVFQRRVSPDILQLKQRLGAGEVGDLVSMTTKINHPLEQLAAIDADGLCLDALVRDVDFLCYMVGIAPRSVMTTAREGGNVTVTLKYPQGITTNIDISRNGGKEDTMNVELCGTNGRIEVALPFRGETKLLTDEQAMEYVQEFQHFLDVIEGREETHMTRNAAISSNVIVHACNASLVAEKEIIIADFATEHGIDEACLVI